MLKFYSFLFISFLHFHSTAQDFKGQWKGQFADQSVSLVGWGGSTCEYVLELETSGTNVTGYSYTYFTEGGKRFYTICKLKGTIDKKAKTIEVTETERTKTNVPANISNCFQVHHLSYSLSEGVEVLQGKWTPAPGQSKNCGYGYTSLTRRKLIRTPPHYNTTNRTQQPRAATENLAVGKPVPRSVTDSKKPRVEIKEKQPEARAAEQVGAMKRNRNHDVVIAGDKHAVEIPAVAAAPGVKFEKRTANLIKTINTNNAVVKISLYDNGTIDGDSVSLFYNDHLIVAGKRLTAEPITLEVPVIPGKVNELVMYADNLGTIPPNTALLIVYDGSKRYEVRITSDLEKSGVIRFIHEE